MQRYFSDKLDNNKFVLSDDDLYHIYKVMRMKDNDLIEVVNDGKVYLTRIDNNEFIVLKELEHTNTFNKEIILCVPLLKEQKMDYILQKATELGVSKIIPLELQRSIIKLDSKRFENRILRWSKICKEASEQSMRNSIPVITNIMKIKDLKELDGIKVLCSTREKNKTFKKLLQSIPNYDKMVIVTGPEGGITDSEEEELIKVGFNPISLGSGILRAETAPLFVLSVLNYENME